MLSVLTDKYTDVYTVTLIASTVPHDHGKSLQCGGAKGWVPKI